MQRRRFLQCSTLAGLAAGMGSFANWPAAAASPAAAGHTNDWAWLVGNWNVRHRRLRERLVGNDDWQDFGGTSAFWLTLGGLGNLDDNVVELPGDSYRGLSLRAYDAASDTWAIWWLDGRDPTRIDPPVHGRFNGDTGIFLGNDTLRGKPIVMRFTWHDIHGAQPWWDQAFSGDGGHTWEVNWRNWFTRTAAQPSPLPLRADAPHDWDFLQGQWRAQHRRLREPFADSGQWENFGGTLAHWPVLGGHGQVAELAMHAAGGEEHGLRVHTYDPRDKQWLAWRLDLQQPTRIDTPTRGRTNGGAVIFTGEEPIAGRSTYVRTTWSAQGKNRARREQAISNGSDGPWKTWWISDFERAG